MTVASSVSLGTYDQMIGVLAALASAAAWAVGSILYKRLGEKVQALSMNLVKNVLSLAILLVVLLASGVQAPGLAVFGALALSGVLGIAVGDTLFFQALQELGAHVLVLLCTLGQVTTVLIAVLFLGERPTWEGWLGIALVIGGVAIVLDSQRSSDGGSLNLRGVARGLAAVLCMSSAIVLAKAAMASVTAIEATVFRTLGGVAGLALWGTFRGGLQGSVAPFRSLALTRELVAAVLVSSLGGFWLFHVALKHIDVATASTLNSTEPLFVLPLAAVFLKERVTRQAVVGALVSVGGIVVLSTR
ncbi:MAG: DMT family transporter [Candidatus Riflebacteria bacterium]|nr:DMT family transporter [Candidatus Riflebacteria bacterium]